jgi:glycosyltransferase involved in cell wall biosynthesis
MTRVSVMQPSVDLAVDRAQPDLLCLSHLRWDFVFQRPQHLLTRAARGQRVFYVEEPLAGDGPPRLDVRTTPQGVHVVVPRLPHGLAGDAADDALRALLDGLRLRHDVRRYVLWYYTPMALGFTRHLRPVATVYDVMDELSLFKFAPPDLLEREAELYRRADVVFTGGRSLYEAKRDRHANVHCFPSSVDAAHFAAARGGVADPADQADIPRPRIGFFGVIDERMDIELLAGVAAARPAWQIVMLGPVVKIDPGVLPRPSNIHYLGGKKYEELPHYIAGWDVAMLPFARNDATRYISPTKTPEYMAAGKPVVSTSIRDVVRPYGQQGLVRIADTVDAFVEACEAAMAEDAAARLLAHDAFLRQTSWDGTWAQMRNLVQASLIPMTAPARAARAL